MIILNDNHIGTLRSAGTTPKSALALREFLIAQLDSCLIKIDEDLIILGDLFDTHTIPLSDWLKVYDLLNTWLLRGHRLYLVAGNHDLNTDSSKVSHLQLLGRLLSGNSKVTYVEGHCKVNDDVYIISHVPNQDLLDYELTLVPKCKYLLVHANYDNDFAKEADHSLNISRDQIAKLPVDTVFFAHEHYYREDMRGKVFVGGNQFPASVSDCLHRDMKCMHRLGDKGIERIETWSAQDYSEIIWNAPHETTARFIRFIGQCSPEESVGMMESVARYRRNSEAFIVSNAVKVVDPDAEDQGIEINSVERVRSFDIMEALKRHLDEDEYKIIESLPC